MKKILLFIPLIILVLIGGYLYQWNINNLRQEVSTNTPSEAINNFPDSSTPTPSPTASEPPPASSSSNISDWRVYQDDKEGYSFEYQSNWTIESKAELPTASGSGMRVVLNKLEEIQFEDKKQKNEAIISIVVNDTNYQNVEQEYTNSLSKEIGQGQTPMTVAGQPALQYDFLYQDMMATETIFLKNDKKFTINYQYSDQETKMKYLENYQRALRTFTID